MKKFIFMALLSANLFGDTSLGIAINTSNGNNQFNARNHYQEAYPDFDYNRYGYQNEDGLYFGFFNQKGYYINDVYFEYRDGYSYYDRLHRRGYFRPHIRHVRYYDYIDNSDCYVEKRYYYYNRYPHYRRHHPYRSHYRDNGRGIEHRNDYRDYYRNDYKDVHRDDRRDHRDNAKVIYERHSDKERR